jgi:hypothetical protein
MTEEVATTRLDAAITRSMTGVVVVLLLILFLMLSGCQKEQVATPTPAPATTEAAAKAETADAADESGFDFSYTDRDKDASYDAATAVVVDLANPAGSASSGVVSTDDSVTLTEEGTYIVRGSTSKLSLVVDAPDDVKVQVVLDGVSITNATAPAFLVKEADKVFVTLAEGSTNILSDGTGRTDLPATEEEEATLEAGGGTVENATLFSHSDLTINGTGKLSASSKSAHAIKSSDDLVITGGSFTIEAATDGLRGKDCVKIADGTFTINAGDDAIVSTNTGEPDTRGFVSIDGGTFSIDAVDDAIHAETILRVAGGTIDVRSCEEGFEGVQVWIQGGEHSIVSNDDGVNAAGDARSDYLLDITGGKLTVNAEGDGIDSNDAITQSGGEVIVYGPTRSGNGALDAERSATITGGTMLAFDMAGMSQGYGSGSTQAAFLLSLPQAFNAGTSVALVDSQGTELFSDKPAKQFSSIAFSSPELAQGGSYTLTANGEAIVSFTLSEAQAQIASDGTVNAYAGEGFGGPGGGAPSGDVGGGPGAGGGAGGMQGTAPEGDWDSGTRPEGGRRGAAPPAAP